MLYMCHYHRTQYLDIELDAPSDDEIADIAAATDPEQHACDPRNGEWELGEIE